MEIIIDTNTLIYSAKEKNDLFALINERYPHAKIIIPEEVLKEVEKIKEFADKFKERKAASLILQILEIKNFKKIKMGEGLVDDRLIKEGLSRNAYVLTADKFLKGKLKKAGVKTMYLKQKRIIEVD